MKVIIASDIHGSAKYCRLLLEAVRRENADVLALLGDILYHGPRNPLPEEYDPKTVAEMLSGIADKIICVRGNCDSEVDQMVLSFPITPDYALLYDGNARIYLSHGHREPPPLRRGDAYVTGHTHIPVREDSGYLHLNPGSVALPKDENNTRGYILYADGEFTFKKLDGEIYNP